MPDARTERLVQQIVHLGRLWGDFRDCQLTGGENGVLCCLYRDGDARPGEISKKIHLSTARVTIVLNALERRGMVTRVPDEEDRRRVNISLTEAGRDYAAALVQRATAEAGNVLTYLGDEDSDHLLHILDRLVTFFERKGETHEAEES